MQEIDTMLVMRLYALFDLFISIELQSLLYHRVHQPEELFSRLKAQSSRRLQTLDPKEMERKTRIKGEPP